MPFIEHIFSRIGATVLSVLMLIGVVALWVIFTFVPLSISCFSNESWQWTSGHPWRQGSCAVVLGIIGFALYQFRTSHRLFYAAFERVVAVGAFWYALGTAAKPQGSAAAIIASLYVFVVVLKTTRRELAGITNSTKEWDWISTAHYVTLPSPI
jgi:hypothetical protein